MGNENEDNLRRYIQLFKEAKNNPFVILVFVASFTGAGSSGFLNIIKPPAPDRYTGTMGAAEETARISGDATLARGLEALGDRTERELRAESKERVRADDQLRRRIQALETELNLCKVDRQQHKVEASAEIEKIRRNTKEIEMIRERLDRGR